MTITQDFIDIADFSQTIATNWPKLKNAVQSLAAHFEQRIVEGVDPAQILVGQIFGQSGQTVNRNDWRIFVDATNNFLIQENTATEASPVWMLDHALPGGRSEFRKPLRYLASRQVGPLDVFPHRVASRVVPQNVPQVLIQRRTDVD